MTSIIKAINTNCFSNEITQLVLSFSWGLATGQWFLTPGWYIVYVIVFQFVVWKITQYFPPGQRGLMYIALNCASFIGQIIGNVIINDKTGLENFVYGIKPNKDTRTRLNRIADSCMNWLDKMTRTAEAHESILQTLN